VGIQPELIKGSSGVFEVQVDDELVFSKRTLGRFPNDSEVEDLVASLLE